MDNLYNNMQLATVFIDCGLTSKLPLQILIVLILPKVCVDVKNDLHGTSQIACKKCFCTVVSRISREYIFMGSFNERLVTDANFKK